MSPTPTTPDWDEEKKRLEVEKLQWETGPMMKIVGALGGIAGIATGFLGLAVAVKQYLEKEEIEVDRKKAVQEQKQTAEQKDEIEHELTQEKMEVSEIEVDFHEKKREKKEAIEALKKRIAALEALRFAALNPNLVSPNLDGSTLPRYPWKFHTWSNLSDSPTLVPQAEPVEQPESSPPTSPSELEKLAAQLFDESGSARVRAYDLITSKFRTHKELPQLLIREAAKHPENIPGIRNVIVALRDMSRTSTQDVEKNKKAIEIFEQATRIKYAQEIVIIEALDSMKKWIFKSSR